MIRLEKITEDNYGDCLKLKVAENQSHFVSSNLHSLAKAYVFYDTVTPFAIYNDELMIGFILLRFNEEYKNYFIWQFMIDEKYQSKGYGKEALKLSVEWMKNQGRCREIVTTYIEGNERVMRIYVQLGFKQIGDAQDGEVDMILYF